MVQVDDGFVGNLDARCDSGIPDSLWVPENGVEMELCLAESLTRVDEEGIVVFTPFQKFREDILARFPKQEYEHAPGMIKMELLTKMVILFYCVQVDESTFGRCTVIRIFLSVPGYDRRGTFAFWKFAQVNKRHFRGPGPSFTSYG